MLFGISKIQPEELYFCLREYIQITKMRIFTGYVLSLDVMRQWL